MLHSIEKLKFDQEITFVAIGRRNSKDTDYKKRKLQYAKVNRIDEKQCYRTWYTKKLIPKNLHLIENRGLCIEGIRKKIFGCAGDSDSPAIWKHKNKDYLIGIQSEDDNDYTNDCEIVKNKVVTQSKLVAIPGVTFKWIKERGGRPIENMLKKC